jgi:Fic family protein
LKEDAELKPFEGEELNAESVRSSLARRMEFEAAGTRPVDRHVEGVVEMMLDATQNYAAPLTEERIFGWHAALFPTGRSGMRKITTGGLAEGSDRSRLGPGMETQNSLRGSSRGTRRTRDEEIRGLV